MGIGTGNQGPSIDDLRSCTILPQLAGLCAPKGHVGSGKDSGRVKYIHMPFNPGAPGAARRGGKTPPPDETFEEAAYLKFLGEKQKAVSIKLADGEVVRGWIEYYDKNMVRLTREGAPNLFIFKHDIMYIAEEAGKRK